MPKNQLKVYFQFLDALQKSGVTNMLGAVPYLLEIYPELSRFQAKEILLDWINSKQNDTVQN